jgi:hypothetical protein
VLERGLAVAGITAYLGGVYGVPAGVGAEDRVDGVEQYVAVRVAAGWGVGIRWWCGEVAGQTDQPGHFGDPDRRYAVLREELLGQPGRGLGVLGRRAARLVDRAVEPGREPDARRVGGELDERIQCGEDDAEVLIPVGAAVAVDVPRDELVR